MDQLNSQVIPGEDLGGDMAVVRSHRSLERLWGRAWVSCV